jgi:hypothetical protein
VLACLSPYLTMYSCTRPRQTGVIIQSHFGMGEEHKIHLVAWDKICSPKQQGVLGLLCFNKHKS